MWAAFKVGMHIARLSSANVIDIQQFKHTPIYFVKP
jgi:hypothetical protein